MASMIISSNPWVLGLSIYAILFIIIGLLQGNLKYRLFILIVTLDVFLFTIVCFGNVKLGECASSAAWDLKIQGKWQGILAVSIINKIFFFQPEHCRKSWEWQRNLYQ